MPAPILTRRRVRLLCTADSFDGPIDTATNKSPKVWLSNAVQFEIVARFGGQIVDPSNWAALTVEIKPQGSGPGSVAPAASVAPLATKTVEDFDGTVDDATWADGTKQHALVSFSATEWNFALSGTEKKWLIVSVLTEDGDTITLSAGEIFVVEDGYNNAGAAAEVEGLAYTQAESLALFGNATYNTITSRTGGGATALDGLATAGGAAATGTTVRTRSGAGGGREEWALEAGTDAEDADAGIVRPDDYDGTTNARVWRQIL